MSNLYANEFSDISATLAERKDLRQAVLQLIDNQPVWAKALEGGDRLTRFRTILKKLVTGEMDLIEAYQGTTVELPRDGSIHVHNNRVFPKDWAERLVRTEYSRFYNQAVMEKLLAEGNTQCFVPHSSQEKPDSKCSIYLAGRVHDLKVLYDRLIEAHSKGNYSSDLKIPDHPHCTHVVTPVTNL